VLAGDALAQDMNLLTFDETLGHTDIWTTSRYLATVDHQLIE
jgi:hypothetical protein